jgi:hypothetical protein
MQLTQTLINCVIIIMAYNQRDMFKLDCQITFMDAVIGFTYCMINAHFYLDTFTSTYIHKKRENKQDRKTKRKMR